MPTADSLFAHRSFMRFWFARVAGAAGNQMFMVAVAWQMYDLTGSAWDLGLVGLLQFIPALLLTFPAGHAADRFDRARILSLCMLVQTALAGALMLGTARGWVTRDWLLLLAIGLGTVRAFQMPTSQSLTPLLVPEALLPRALAFSSAGMEASVIAGPAIGGFVYAFGAHAVHALCTLLFGLAALLLHRIRYERPPVGTEPVTWSSAFAGIGFIWRRKVVLGAISLDLFAVLFGGATALLPMFAKDVLHVGPWGLGLLRSAPAIGALAMSLVLTRWPMTRGVGRLLFSAVVIYGLSTLAFALSTSLLLSIVMLAVSGAADMVSVVIRLSLVQLETPNEMRGRVSAVNSIFIGASNQLGEFESGAVASWLGPVGSVVLGGVGTLIVAAAWMRLFPSLSRRESLTGDR